MTTLQEYMHRLGWDTTTLAREAKINYNTAKKARDGEYIRSSPAIAISQAISQATGEKVHVGDIEELFVLQ
jgi:hypothetical protein